MEDDDNDSNKGLIIDIDESLLNRKRSHCESMNNYEEVIKAAKEEENRQKAEKVYEFNYRIFLNEFNKEGYIKDFIGNDTVIFEERRIKDPNDVFNFGLTHEKWIKLLNKSILMHYERHLVEKNQVRLVKEIALNNQSKGMFSLNPVAFPLNKLGGAFNHQTGMMGSLNTSLNSTGNPSIFNNQPNQSNSGNMLQGGFNNSHLPLNFNLMNNVGNIPIGTGGNFSGIQGMNNSLMNQMIRSNNNQNTINPSNNLQQNYQFINQNNTSMTSNVITQNSNNNTTINSNNNEASNKKKDSFN